MHERLRDGAGRERCASWWWWRSSGVLEVLRVRGRALEMLRRGTRWGRGRLEMVLRRRRAVQRSLTWYRCTTLLHLLLKLLLLQYVQLAGMGVARPGSGVVGGRRARGVG